MKQILFLVMLACSAAVSAQQVKLNKGQQITITNMVTQDMDMGMGMQIKNNSNSTSVLQVTDADNKNYNGIYKLTKLNTSFEGMGKQEGYDSEKPEDKDSEFGKSLGDKIGKEVKVTIDKNTGKAIPENIATPEKKDEEGADPLNGLMEMFGTKDGQDAIAESVFFMLPAGKKIGDSWTDSMNIAEMKGTKTYTLKAINGDEAIVSLFSKVEGSQNIELQGMQMDISLSAKTEGEILTNIKTAVMKKSSKVVDISGTMDLMGQSMPFTSKMTETIECK